MTVALQLTPDFQFHTGIIFFYSAGDSIKRSRSKQQDHDSLGLNRCCHALIIHLFFPRSGSNTFDHRSLLMCYRWRYDTVPPPPPPPPPAAAAAAAAATTTTKTTTKCMICWTGRLSHLFTLVRAPLRLYVMARYLLFTLSDIGGQGSNTYMPANNVGLNKVYFHSWKYGQSKSLCEH